MYGRIATGILTLHRVREEVGARHRFLPLFCFFLYPLRYFRARIPRPKTLYPAVLTRRSRQDRCTSGAQYASLRRVISAPLCYQCARSASVPHESAYPAPPLPPLRRRSYGFFLFRARRAHHRYSTLVQSSFGAQDRSPPG